MKLTVSMAQMAVVTSRPEENLRKAEGFIAEARRRSSDLVCFPEMWTTGFNWANNERIAAGQAKTIELVAGMAKRYSIWINGSMLALNEDGKAANTSILFDPKGAVAGIYRKAHLFTLLHEDDHMAAGNSLCLVDTPWGKTGLTVCYDIRFPELFRTYALKGAKVILSPMAFPYPRIQHWKVLVRARAIEDQLFMIGTNRVGSEDLGKDGTISYFGDSVIIDPWGETVVEGSEAKEELLTATIDVDKVDEIREKMKVLKDRRPDLYELG
jgi:predicted amidohydrolase